MNVPEVDVAAALAVVLRGDQPLLLEPEPERPRFEDRKNRDRGNRDSFFDQRDEGGREARGGKKWRDDRPGRGSGPSRGRSDVEYATYRIAVGKRQRVEPRQIVGAIANEGGLGRQDFGHIDIRMDYSLVELPAQLPPGAWDKLRSTRISGQLIELSEASPSNRKPHRAPRDDR